MWQTFKARLLRLHKSWTAHFNIFYGLLVLNLPTIIDNMPQLQPYLPANIYQCAMGVFIAGNLLLRIKTTQPLDAK